MEENLNFKKLRLGNATQMSGGSFIWSVGAVIASFFVSATSLAHDGGGCSIANQVMQESITKPSEKIDPSVLRSGKAAWAQARTTNCLGGYVLITGDASGEIWHWEYLGYGPISGVELTQKNNEPALRVTFHNLLSVNQLRERTVIVRFEKPKTGFLSRLDGYFSSGIPDRELPLVMARSLALKQGGLLLEDTMDGITEAVFVLSEPAKQIQTIDLLGKGAQVSDPPKDQ